MLNVPSALPVPWIVANVPSGWGMSACGASPNFVQSNGRLVDPLAVHCVLTQLPLMVPLGETFQDCVPRPPSLVVAVMVKASGRRDWEAVGVQERVLPLTAAPDGALLSAKATVPPAGSVAVIE